MSGDSHGTTINVDTYDHHPVGELISCCKATAAIISSHIVAVKVS